MVREDGLVICDIKAEMCVLASILEDATVFELVQPKLRSEQFYVDANQKIFAAMERLRERGDDITLPSVRDYLFDSGEMQRVGEKYLENDIFIATPAITDPSREAERIAERAKLRDIQSTCKQFLAETYITNMEDIPDLLTRFESSIADTTRDVGSGSIVTMRDAVFDYAKQLQDRLTMIQLLKSKGLPTIEITTGIDRLDEMTGGLHRGNCCIVAGRPGMGKSAFGMKLCQSVAGTQNYQGQDLAAAFISLEMPQKDLVMRLAATEARVDIIKARKNELSKEDSFKFFQALNEIAKKPISVVCEAYRLSDIRTAIRKLKLRYEREEKELVLVCIDYLQLIMDTQAKTQTRENVVGLISRSLKQIAISENLCIALLAQLNRECEATKDKRPYLHHLRESGSIEQDADEVIFLLRKEQYWQQNEDCEGMCELILAKQRNGPIGSVLTAFRKSCTRFDDLEPDDEDGYMGTLYKWNNVPKGSRR